MSKNYLSKNDELRKGDYLVSNNGNYKAIFQGDGNFVIYTWKPLWGAGTNGDEAFRLCMQGDSNLVMFNKNGTPRWSTDSYGSEAKMCRLQLTDDGNLVVSKEGEEVWSSAHSKGKRH